MIDDILQERNARYGDFRTEAMLAQRVRNHLLNNPNGNSMGAVSRHALEMICVKLARIVNGDPKYKDNWQDIIGYCTLVLRHIEESEQ